MRFQIISHACALFENKGKRLLVDPWIIGSAYWRSWWHMPEALPIGDEVLAADWIYLTHQHFDHFHYPSLRKFRRDVEILVPERPIPSMEAALADLGFHRVRAMPHGATFDFDGGFRLTSYQAGWNDDSVLMIEAGGTTIADFNDAKLEDASLSELVRRHRPIDFVLRSHSYAQAYPQCYASPDPADLSMRQKEDYVRDFLNTARRCRARFAIPFASNVACLHPETIHKNDDWVSPDVIAERYQKQGSNEPEVVVMLPGAQWDSEMGFQLVPLDPLKNKKEEIQRLGTKYAATLARQESEESTKQLDYQTFQTYMQRFLRSLPFALRFFYRARVAYDVLERGEWWILDFGRRRVERVSERPADVASITRVKPGLLQDALEKSIVNFIDISKRLRVEMSPGRAVDHFVFRELLTLYEAGYFPLHRSISFRFLRVWWRRRTEVYSYVRKLFRRDPRAFIPAVEPKQLG